MQRPSKHVLSIIFILTTTLFSCSKKNNDPAPSNNKNPVASDGGSYLPLTKGNHWNYTYTNSDFTYSLTATENTKTFNDKPYSVLTRMVPGPWTSPIYSYQDGNKYYSYELTTPYSLVPLELKLIDLDLPIGTPWSVKYEKSQYVDEIYTLKVLDTNMTRTVNNIQYSHVLAVESVKTISISEAELQLLKELGLDQANIQAIRDQLATQAIPWTTYYAKNVGMIEQTSAMSELNVQLMSSTIK